jgi:hypothetical protein
LQANFGDIGELVKIRIEIDEGVREFYLDDVELLDLDTGEQMRINCGKWLRWKSKEKNNVQPFRELAAFRAGVPPSPCTAPVDKTSTMMF